MFAVGLLSLSTLPDTEAAALAPELGVTTYEAGQRVRSLPSIVLRTADSAQASALEASLTRRGHEAFAIDLATVTNSREMHVVRGFKLEADALVSEKSNERLLWSEVRCAVRAIHSGTEETTEVKRSSMTNPIPRLDKNAPIERIDTSTEKTTRVARREPVLYLFRKTGTAWLLAESQVHYAALGTAIKPTRQDNFNTVLRLVRERLPHTPWDERLLSVRARAEANSNNAAAMDLFAHLVVRGLISRSSD